MEGRKTMLGIALRQSRHDDGEQEALQDSRAEQRDGTIRGALVCRLSRFQDRDNHGGFPHGWNVGVADRQVIKIS